MDPDRILPPEAFTNTTGEMPLPMSRISNDELAALRADKQRLDWLDEWTKERDAVYEEGDPDVGCPSAWQIWSRQTGSEERRMLQFAPSLRAAIDGARKG